MILSFSTTSIFNSFTILFGFSFLIYSLRWSNCNKVSDFLDKNCDESMSSPCQSSMPGECCSGSGNISFLDAIKISFIPL